MYQEVRRNFDLLFHTTKTKSSNFDLIVHNTANQVTEL